jgi:transcriptional regulator with XRE-family HTH domain
MAERINQHRNSLIGANIRRLRKERDMKAVDVIAQLQLRDVNVTTGIFSKVEHGLNNPSVDMLIALTDILGCDYNAFFEQEKKKD